MEWQTMATAKHTRYPALGKWELTQDASLLEDV